MRLDGVDVGEKGVRILLARVLGPLGPSFVLPGLVPGRLGASFVLPGALGNAVLTDCWLVLSREGEFGLERTKFGSSPFFM